MLAKAIRIVVLSSLVVLVVSAGGLGQSTETKKPRIIPLQPLSKDFEVIYGDPEAVGEPFVMRIRELPGTIIPPHKHPVDEHITVVQGTIYFAVGEKFNRAAMKEIKTGGYAFIPKGSTMFGYIPDGAIVQVHGVGPFHIHWRAGGQWLDKDKTLDDPDAGSIFKFKKGEHVVTKRGKGRIRQGYFSGEILQYEIDGEDGTLYMVNEEELRRQ
ncbi:MAG TPA: cupin domain-containing protein [Pyrinomonadaceae bacterium]|nr:cupin domain-containing protein [Pyrinomonadaceae bacterium]